MEIKFNAADLDPLVRQIVRETMASMHQIHPASGKQSQPAELQPMLLCSRDAAKLLGICERTLWTLTNKGEIPAVRIGQSCRYAPADLNRWIEKKKHAPVLPKKMKAAKRDS
jgi:excisionase family DNA binding protein